MDGFKSPVCCRERSPQDPRAMRVSEPPKSSLVRRSSPLETAVERHAVNLPVARLACMIPSRHRGICHGKEACYAGRPRKSASPASILPKIPSLKACVTCFPAPTSFPGAQSSSTWLAAVIGKKCTVASACVSPRMPIYAAGCSYPRGFLSMKRGACRGSEPCQGRGETLGSSAP